MRRLGANHATRDRKKRNSVREKLLVQPGPGVGPVAIHGARGDAQHVGDLGDGEAGEVLQLHDLGGGAVLPSEPLQGIVEGDEIMDRRSNAINHRLVLYSLLVSAALEAMLAPI